MKQIQHTGLLTRRWRPPERQICRTCWSPWGTMFSGSERTTQQRRWTAFASKTAAPGTATQKGQEGTPRFASCRGTYDRNGPGFKGDVAGSDKRIAFRLPSKPDLDWVLVFEAPIDRVGAKSISLRFRLRRKLRSIPLLLLFPSDPLRWAPMGALPYDLLQSHTARTMLANSEFLVMLNQASTDRAELAKLLNISDNQLSYISNVDFGRGLLKCGSAIVPFLDNFPKNRLYHLMTTRPSEVGAA